MLLWTERRLQEHLRQAIENWYNIKFFIYFYFSLCVFIHAHAKLVKQALGISEEYKTEDVLNSMDANGDGTIDLEEWTTCMTPELKRAIYRSLANPDKLNGFQPLVDVAKVRN